MLLVFVQTLYITYIHGQLDVVPIIFLFVSSYFLFKKKNMLSALILGLGIVAKTNLVLVIPFYILYVSHFTTTNQAFTGLTRNFF